MTPVLRNAPTNRAISAVSVPNFSQLRSILEALMTDAMYEMPSKNITKSLRINLAFVEDKFNQNALSKLKVA